MQTVKQNMSANDSKEISNIVCKENKEDRLAYVLDVWKKHLGEMFLLLTKNICFYKQK